MYSALVLLDNQKRMMYYLMVLVLLFLAELFYFRVADRYNIIDKPNERSSHTKVTLRGGGFYIVHEANERHQCQGKQEPGIFKATRQEIGQRSEIENNPTTA